MKQINELFEGNELSNYLNRQIVNEGAVGDFFKKTWNYLKNTIAKVGNFFVALYNDKVLPVITPITSQIAIKNSKLSSFIHWVGNSEDNKFSGVDTNGNNLLESYPSTLEAWRKAANTVPVKESFDEMLLEKLKLTSDDTEIPNADDDMLDFEIRTRLQGANVRPLLVWGAPGIGKTAIIKKALKAIKGKNARLVDLQTSKMGREDFFFPGYNKDKTLGVDLPKACLPVWKKTKDMTAEECKAADEACGEGLLFFDELSRASREVVNVCLKIIGERLIGEDYIIGSGWTIIAASNRFEDDEDSQARLGKAIGNRFEQINYCPCFKSWRQWAEKHGYMNKNVLDWLELNEKNYFYFDANDETTLYASPRSWEAACLALANIAHTAEEEEFDLLAIPDNVIQYQIAKSVGNTAARAFMTYVDTMRTVDIDKLKLVLTQPDKAPLPTKNGRTYKQDELYIFVTMIASFVKEKPSGETYTNICKYFARLDDESAAGKIHSYLCRKFPEMNNQFGDVPGWDDTYAEGLKILIDAYPDWENADFSN